MIRRLIRTAREFKKTPIGQFRDHRWLEGVERLATLLRGNPEVTAVMILVAQDERTHAHEGVKLSAILEIELTRTRPLPIEELELNPEGKITTREFVRFQVPGPLITDLRFPETDELP